MKYQELIYTLTAILVLLQCFDITTTVLIFSYNGRELNPFANPYSRTQFILKLTAPTVLGIFAILPTIIIKTETNKEKKQLEFFKLLMEIIFYILIIFYIGINLNNTYCLTQTIGAT